MRALNSLEHEREVALDQPRPVSRHARDAASGVSSDFLCYVRQAFAANMWEVLGAPPDHMRYLKQPSPLQRLCTVGLTYFCVYQAPCSTAPF